MARQAWLRPRPHNVIRPQQEGDKDNRPHNFTKVQCSSWTCGAAVLGLATKPELPLQG